jgi:hypothetical protein
MKQLIALFVAFLITFIAYADEGIWLPSQIAEKIADMRKKGCKLTAEDIYSINSSSIKDAIVQFNGGCTGELISDKGLLITNHHCGFGRIQAHSSVDHDYLKDGFWATKMSEELPNPGTLSVSFLEYMKDVTAQVLKGYSTDMTELQRDSLVEANSKVLKREATKAGKGLHAVVTPLYYGNQYFIFVYKVYKDVRLVGAPPSSIGKFGGDTDNWMWPRHTGDFSLFRIYAGKDNEPADYSPENVPYVPKRALVISTKGVQEGDFTMVYGYPGRTQEYITSDAVRYISEISNPAKIRLRTMVLDIQKREMAKQQRVRIAYASKNAGVANSWKKWQGEMNGIIKLNTVAQKRAFEREFSEWAKDKSEYNGLVERLSELYKSIEELSLVSDYQREALNSVEIIKYAGSAKRNDELFFKDYYQPIDKEVFIALYGEYNRKIEDKYKSDFFKAQIKKYGTVEVWADSLFSSRFGVNNAGNMKMAEEIFRNNNSYYNRNVVPVLDSVTNQITLLYRTFMRGRMEYAKSKGSKTIFYPDANSTLRVAYGNIAGYSPADAVYYTPVSTLEGIIQKDNPEIYDYNIPQKLRDLHNAKEYGRWNVGGTVPVAFIATNHTSGGNSGSPVLNANGELVGINFDRVWEGTMSDVVFDSQLCRNISLDIRYALFVIDKLAGAEWLISEMKLR